MASDYRALLKNKAFLYLWASQVLSQVTINALNFLLLTRLFNITGSTIATSFLWISYALPAIVVGPVAAVFVDTLNRKKILMVTNLLQSLTIFLYALSYKNSLFLLYGVVVMYSLFNQFYVPSEQSALPSLVGKKLLPEANGLFFTTQQLSLIIGFGLSTPLASFLGFNVALLVNAFFLFLAFISVCFLPNLGTKLSVRGILEESIEEVFRKILKGYEYIKGNKYVLAPFILLVGLQVLLTIMMVNIPIITEQIFSVKMELAGVFLILPAGIGAGIGTLLIPRFLKQNVRKIKVIMRSFSLLIGCLFLTSSLVPFLKQPFAIILGAVLLFIMGFSFIGIIIPTQTFFQENTPLDFRGRVFGNYWFLVTVVSLLPVLFSGTITELFGIKALLFLLTGILVLVVILIKKKGDYFLINTNEI